MSSRFHLLFGFSALALATTSASAVEMGNINVQSSLNEPFMASIPLSNLGSAAKDIRVSVASKAEYSTLGMHKNKADIQYKIQDNGDGTAVLWLRSQTPIKDPFLDLVLNVKDDAQTKQHKVSALINPKASDKKPVNDKQDFLAEDLNSTEEVPLNTINAAPPPLSSVVSLPSVENDPYLADAQSTGSESPYLMDNPNVVEAKPLIVDSVDTQSKPKKTKPKTTQPKKTPKYKAENTGKYSVVRRDTLWGIATKISKEKNIPVKQLMKDIQAMNKNAFVNNNPNKLKSGVKLVVPSFEGLEALNARNSKKAMSPTKKSNKTAKSTSGSVKKNATIAKKSSNQPKNKTTKSLSTKQKPTNTSASTTKKADVKKTQKLKKSELRIVTKKTAKGSAEGDNNKTTTANRKSKLPPAIITQVKQSRKSTIDKRKRVNKLNTELKSFNQKIKLQSTKLAELEARLKQLNAKKKNS